MRENREVKRWGDASDSFREMVTTNPGVGLVPQHYKRVLGWVAGYTGVTFDTADYLELVVNNESSYAGDRLEDVVVYRFDSGSL